MPVTDSAGLLAAVAAALPEDEQAIAVAVSGGGDSLALLHLAHLVGARVHAVTVDHGLRAGAAAEVALVARHCADWGIPHQVLVWDHGGQIAGNLMAAARTARYALMADWARGAGVGTVWLAHTADDQAEGFLMALARGAGLDGLSGMRADWRADGARFARPLLAVSRQALRDHLTRAGIAWAEDPSNTNDRFTRARIRKALAVLEPLGLGAAQLAQSVQHLATARAALDQTLAGWATDHVQTVAGLLRIERAAFAALPGEQRRRLLLAGLRWLNRAEYPPRGADQARFLASLAQGRGATLQGVRAKVTPRAIVLMREGRAVLGVTARPGSLWDGRWRVAGPFPERADLRALGAAGLALRPDWRDAALPRDALLTAPAVWCGEALIAVPLLDAAQGWTCEYVGEFRLFVLSH
ncbi:MAG: tRNA lysidine(34) synthetase TilS [Rhodobacteraceae bacterium PARR1]|nr:MAG: tRNA lysidine(34) synthetase TilS [Rhodobacteraceae bacterium PARR1]